MKRVMWIVLVLLACVALAAFLHYVVGIPFAGEGGL